MEDYEFHPLGTRVRIMKGLLWENTGSVPKGLQHFQQALKHQGSQPICEAFSCYLIINDKG